MPLSRLCQAVSLAAFILAAPALAASDVVRTDHAVQGEPGISLFVRELRAKEADRSGHVPIILLHGARVPGVASFDLPVPGGSLAADLALAGHPAFVMDLRGYGGSTRPAAMDMSPAGPPLTPSHEAVRDLGAVVDWVRARTGQDRVALLGWATGGHWAGMYASLHPERVSHLVLYNTLYGGTDGHSSLGRGSETEDPARPGQFNAARIGAYRLSTAASLMPAWDRSIPIEDKAAWRDPAVAAAYQREALASDPASAGRTPPAFRAPSGAIQDSYYLATGRQLWDAAPITARVMLLRSERDFWSRPDDASKLQSHLVNAAEVRATTIPRATHFVHLDRPEGGRAVFLSEVEEFLAARSTGGADMGR